MSATDSLHYNLCRKAATFLHNGRNHENTRGMETCKEDYGYHGAWRWVTVEMVTQGSENPDVWATNGSETVVVEVKTSRADFLRDQKKWHRKAEMEYYQSGNFRYYLSPEGVITEADLPEGWGLLVWDGKKIRKAKQAAFRKVSNHADLIMACSIMRREGVVPKTYDYRNANPMGKPSCHMVAFLPRALQPYTEPLERLYMKMLGKADPKQICQHFNEGKLTVHMNGQQTYITYNGKGFIYNIDCRTLEADFTLDNKTLFQPLIK